MADATLKGTQSNGTQTPITCTPLGEAWVYQRPQPGSRPYSYIAAGSANQDSQVVKNTPGVVKAIVCVCTVATMRYLKVYDKATNPLSTDIPVLRIPVPATSTTGNSIPIMLPPEGVQFQRGISFRMCTGVADSDANAVTAADLVLDVVFQ